jgi:hypothetical protein
LGDSITALDIVGGCIQKMVLNECGMCVVFGEHFEGLKLKIVALYFIDDLLIFS